MASASEGISSIVSMDSGGIFHKRRKNIVGLLNQGGTCYLNSLLQTLFHTPEFTYRLFNLTTSHQQSGLKSIIRELLRLFYSLMTMRKYAISSKSLTDSFGWNDEQVFVHQDVQELNRLLFEEIETSLRGTAERNLINDLYKGSIVTKITCLRCGYCSIREDEYLDVNLAVIEHNSVESCLRGVTAVERLCGDNQYFCDKCKRKVDASKVALFKEYPPILTLCLARFDFDPRTMQSLKVDKCCSFPITLDVSEFMIAPPKSRKLYDLFSIVIHVGTSTLGGHYHAFIKDPYGFEIKNEDNENNIEETKDVVKKYFSQTFNDDCVSNSGSDVDSDHFFMANDVTMTGDESDTVKQNSIFNDSKMSQSKKSFGKIGALFEAIKSFWNGSTYQQVMEASTDYVQNQMYGVQMSIPEICCETATLTYQKSSIEEKDFLNRRISTFEVDNNNNESKPQLFRSKDDTNNVNFDDTIEHDGVPSSISSKSVSKSKPTMSTSLVSTQTKLKFQSDKMKRLSSNELLLKTSNSDSNKSEKSKYSNYVESGRWFDFNDETITEIQIEDFKRVFEGQECAYMLFYRNRGVVDRDRHHCSKH